jgi:hypothetical protein
MTNPTPAPLNSPFLRSQRQFPVDSSQALSVEIDKTYIDIAQKLNDRTIGLFPTNRPVITGESWFLRGPNQKQQSQRQVYAFKAADLPNIAHNINLSQISGFVRIWGTFVDSGGVWYPLPFVSATAAANQVQIQVGSTNIVITVGAGAPVPVTGFVILEWLANS